MELSFLELFWQLSTIIEVSGTYFFSGAGAGLERLGRFS